MKKIFLLIALIATIRCASGAIETDKEGKTVFLKTKLGGYVQGQYEAYPGAAVNTSTDTFNIKRVRIEMKSELSEDFSGSLSFEATKFNTTTALKTAYLDWKRYDYLNVRFGQFKIPFSRESLQSDSHIDFIERAMVVDNLVTKLPDSYDTGIQFSGKKQSLDYAFAITNGTAENTPDDNQNKATIARVVINPLKGIYAGGSAYYSENGKTFALRRKFGAELKIEMPLWFAQAEYIKNTEITKDSDGWYVYAFVIPLKSLQTGMRYERYDDSESVTIGVNYFFAKNVKFVFNATQNNTKDKSVQNAVISRVQFIF